MPMDVPEFGQLADEFAARIRRITWCTVATVAPNGAPWTRVLHPIWEEATGWIATTRRSPKASHIEHEPRVSLTYWDAEQDVVTVHGVASWVDDEPTRARIWALYRETPPPLGYDPAPFWQTPTNPAFGLLRIDPTRIEVTGLASSPKPRMVWRPR
jgi:general stress protein 26